jgi:hypothetical protein
MLILSFVRFVRKLQPKLIHKIDPSSAPARLENKRFADLNVDEFACPPDLLSAPRFVEANAGNLKIYFVIFITYMYLHYIIIIVYYMYYILIFNSYFINIIIYIIYRIIFMFYQ